MVQATRIMAILAIGSLAVACGERAEEQADEPTPVVSGEPTPFENLPMPDFPEPRNGYLVVKGAGTYMLDGAWAATASMCEDPPMMQILAQQPGIGTLILLQLPAEDERLTDYPVTFVEEGSPPAPASQIGVQVFQGGTVATFQAMDGQVTVFGFGQGISGRFAVVLREVTSEDRQKFAGSFQNVLIEEIPEDDCRQLREALAAPDAAATDTTSQ